MHSISGFGAAVGALALLPIITRSHVLPKRIFNDPAGIYVQRLCYPLFSNSTWRNQFSANDVVYELAESQFPCERVYYFRAACRPNGTQEIDFLAGQQCLCGSSLWTLMEACNRCHSEHGLSVSSPAEATSSISKLSAAFCTQAPPVTKYLDSFMPFLDITSISNAPPITLGEDKFPNNTAVSNYFTPTGTGGWTLGEITGSVTARQTIVVDVEIVINSNGDVQTLTFTRETSGTVTPKTSRTVTPTTTETVTSEGRPNETSSSTQDLRAATSGTSASAATTPTPSNAATVTGRGYGYLRIRVLSLCLVYVSFYI